VIDRAHAQGVKVLAATIYSRDAFTAAQNAERHAVNNWVRNVGDADGLLDLDELFKSPDDPEKINPAYNCDGIHPNTAGYALWANSMDLAFFAPPPDLTVSAVNTVLAGSRVTFSAVVTNVGGGPASSFGVRFLVDGVQLGVDQTVAQLDSGAAATVTASKPWDVKRGSPHTVEVRVDPGNAVAESDESNNTARRTFTVVGNKLQ
jgi:hypothetical protein